MPRQARRQSRWCPSIVRLHVDPEWRGGVEGVRAAREYSHKTDEEHTRLSVATGGATHLQDVQRTVQGLPRIAASASRGRIV